MLKLAYEHILIFLFWVELWQPVKLNQAKPKSKPIRPS